MDNFSGYVPGVKNQDKKVEQSGDDIDQNGETDMKTYSRVYQTNMFEK